MMLYSRIDTRSLNCPNTSRIKTAISIPSKETPMNIGILADKAKNIKTKSASQILKL